MQLEYIVQCNVCSKSRLVQEKFLPIEDYCHGLPEGAFVCARAQEWGETLECINPTDVEEDEQASPTSSEHSEWLPIDDESSDEDKKGKLQSYEEEYEELNEKKKEEFQLESYFFLKSVPSPPKGFNRRVVIRVNKSSRFADVYYDAPCGMTLRSMPDVERYLDKHPEFGANVMQFAFEGPRPVAAKAENGNEEAVFGNEEAENGNEEADNGYKKAEGFIWEANEAGEDLHGMYQYRGFGFG